MTETKQMQVTFEFEAGRGTWLAMAAAGGLLVAAILAAVTLGVGWGEYTTHTTGNGFNVQSQASYEMFEIDGEGGNAEYSESSFDDFEGIGLMRAAGPLAVTGMALGFLGAIVLGTSLFLRRLRLTLIGSLVATVATILLVLVAVLLPIGISQFHGDLQSFGGSGGGFTNDIGDISWGAGLFLGVIGAVLAIGAAVAGFLSLRHPNVS